MTWIGPQQCQCLSEMMADNPIMAIINKSNNNPTMSNLHVISCRNQATWKTWQPRLKQWHGWTSAMGASLNVRSNLTRQIKIWIKWQISFLFACNGDQQPRKIRRDEWQDWIRRSWTGPVLNQSWSKDDWRAGWSSGQKRIMSETQLADIISNRTKYIDEATKIKSLPLLIF